MREILVIGSGPAGSSASQELISLGYKVNLIDGGIVSESSLFDSVEGSFEDIRLTNHDQNELFLGKNFQGLIPKGSSAHSSSMVSGNRKHVSEKTAEFLPIYNQNEIILQSLAKGGLSESWGAACDFFTNEELKKSGIFSERMKEFYQKSINEVGISGESSEYALMPPAKLDHNASAIFQSYQKKRSQKEFEMNRAYLALLTKDLGARKKTKYVDLEYHSNPGNSTYRSRFTIEKLEKNKNFKYSPGNVVFRFEEKESGVVVYCKSLDGKSERVFKGDYLFLATGSINTARLFLKSKAQYYQKKPLIIKEHLLMPCIYLKSLGKRGDVERHSLCQLMIKNNKTSDDMISSFTQLYSYKSLLLYKLVNFSPLIKPESMRIFSNLASSLIIADIRFPTTSNAQVSLISQNDKDLLKIDFEKKDLISIHKDEIRRIKKFLLSLGIVPLKIVQTPFGSTAHYAGGVDIDPQGRLRGYKRVFVADASSWKALPAKPPALTIMANARRIAHSFSNTIPPKK